MMMIPRRNFDLFDNFFDDSFFKKEEKNLMKTDIKKHKDKYVIDMDLPGYEKENIKISIDNGYLTINATTATDNNEKDDEGNFIFRERYSGQCSRSFYVGDNIKEDDIKANFRNGTLTIEIPTKENKPEIPEKKFIQIGD